MPTLVLLSLVFYSYWDIRFLPVMVGSILGNWLAARAYAQTKRVAILTTAIIANLVVLGIFKYTNFFADNAAYLLGRPLPHLALALPLGISFFTFHHIMYLVDLRRGRAPIYPLDRYALYICFFPQAISGPIARWNEVIQQFGRQAFAPGWERRCALGATFIVIGLVQKTLLADPLAQGLDPIYAQAAAGAVPANAWMAPAFAFQVFFDFAGYSDIAIGLELSLRHSTAAKFQCSIPQDEHLWNLWQSWHSRRWAPAFCATMFSHATLEPLGISAAAATASPAFSRRC